MSVAERLLSRLDRVKRTGTGQWLACCPAHADRSPSLSVKETDDGRLLLHCFAGCGPIEVLIAAGLRFADLYPEPLSPQKPIRRPYPSADVLEAVASDCFFVAVTAAHIAEGGEVTADIRAALHQAAVRIADAREVSLGR
jgi:hypothetical protein